MQESRVICEVVKKKDQQLFVKVAQLINKSTTTVTRYLNKMIELGIIEKKGKSYNTIYCLII